MRIYQLAAGGWLCLAVLAAAGCGSKGTDGTPTASIGSPTLSAGQSLTSNLSPARAPKPRTENKHPKVIVDTSLGALTLELDAEKAPLTVENFLSYVDGQFYDQTIFHQVVKNYIALGGGYSPTMAEKRVVAKVRNEAHNGLKNRRGAIAMARNPGAVDSATCQFFINLQDNPPLDHKDRTLQGYGYCVFGQVVAGDDVLDRIGGTPVHNIDQFNQTPVTPVVIKSIRRVE